MRRKKVIVKSYVRGFIITALKIASSSGSIVRIIWFGYNGKYKNGACMKRNYIRVIASTVLSYYSTKSYGTLCCYEAPLWVSLLSKLEIYFLYITHNNITLLRSVIILSGFKYNNFWKYIQPNKVYALNRIFVSIHSRYFSSCKSKW